MLKNAYVLAKIGADTAENEQHFAKIVPIGRRVAVDTRRQAGLPRGEALRGHGAKAAACVWSHSELGRIGKISISK